MTNTLAFVFPGQGSQQVGMLADYAEDTIVQQTFAEASAVLGFDLWQLVSQGPAEQLNQTENTQPALLTASVALWRVWQQQGGQTPAVMTGHSLGEYSALVCAGVIPFADAVKLVHLRGLFMQQAVAVGEGAMAAIIGLEDAKVIEACETASTDENGQTQVVSAVNFNAPGQVVIAGQAAAVAKAIDAAKALGAKRGLPLPVSVPSHCALMKPAANKLAEVLETIEFSVPAIPVIQNVSAQVCESPATLKVNLLAQLYSPVRWVESVELMDKMCITQFVECGAGKVLAGLNKRIIAKTPTTAIESKSAMITLISAV